MIPTPTQVWLVVEPVDMRAYAEFSILRSCRMAREFRSRRVKDMGSAKVHDLSA
jgi:hypothetical protein